MTISAPSSAHEASVIAATERTYDELPYISHPFPVTHPLRLAGAARLFGLDAPAMATARVLEIGCASGGNIIPMAFQFPGANFVGIDLSSRQVEDGRARIAKLGLRNIELRCGDVSRFTDDNGPFDYIICHGVYSWVPQSVREAILRISGEKLSKDGIAYISYNVLPGWRKRQVIRDGLLLNIPPEASPKDRVARARVILDTMKEQTGANTTDGNIWRTEAELLASKRDDYILHEFLEQTNEPCSFSEFIAAAGRYGLAYLAEADLNAMIPENISPNAGEAIRRISGNKLISGEQNVDIVTGRTFRQTMLVHESRAASVQRLLTPASLKGLHLLAQINCREITDTKPGEWVFDGTNDRRFTTTSPVVAEALRHLMGRLPSTTAVNDLIKINPATTANENSVLDALFKIVLVGSAAPVSEAIDGMAALTERPIVSAIAAVDAASGAASTVTPRHEVVSLDVVSHVIFPLLDGTRDRDALVAELFHQAELGKITFQKDNMRVTDETVVRLGCAEHIDRVLAIAARSGLLT